MKTIARSESKYAGNAAAVLALISDERVYPDLSELEDRGAESRELGTNSAAKGIQIIPNPNDGRFEIYLDGKELDQGDIWIYRSSGELVYNEVLYDNGGGPLSTSPPGLYFIVIRLENGQVHTQKVVVQ